MTSITTSYFGVNRRSHTCLGPQPWPGLYLDLYMDCRGLYIHIWCILHQVVYINICVCIIYIYKDNITYIYITHICLFISYIIQVETICLDAHPRVARVMDQARLCFDGYIVLQSLVRIYSAHKQIYLHWGLFSVRLNYYRAGSSEIQPKMVRGWDWGTFSSFSQVEIEAPIVHGDIFRCALTKSQ